MEDREVTPARHTHLFKEYHELHEKFDANWFQTCLKDLKEIN